VQKPGSQAESGVFAGGTAFLHPTGYRESLGLDVVTAEDGAASTAFRRGLVARGLAGVRLVTSDARPGLVDAIAATCRAPPGSEPSGSPLIPSSGRDVLVAAASRPDQPDRLTPKLRRIRPRKPRGHLASPSSPDDMLTKRPAVQSNG